MKHILTTLILLHCIAAFGQQKIIVLKNDTIIIEQSDIIYYRSGDEFNGELKYGGDGYSIVLKIDSGFVINRKHYFQSGKLQSESNYKKGRLNGNFKNWNENGILLFNGYYFNGYEDSIWTFYRQNGLKETEGAFLADTTHLIKNFTWVIYRQDIPTAEFTETRISKELHSPPNGEWNFYDKNGKKIKSLLFDKGIIISIDVGDYPDE